MESVILGLVIGGIISGFAARQRRQIRLTEDLIVTTSPHSKEARRIKRQRTDKAIMNIIVALIIIFVVAVCVDVYG